MKRNTHVLLVLMLCASGFGCAGRHIERSSSTPDTAAPAGHPKRAQTNSSLPVVRSATGTNQIYYQWRRNTN
jgi:hypothetical protein